jgi:glutaredoxin
MVEVYSKTNCPYCDRAKDLLTRKGIEFNVVNIEEDQAARQTLADLGLRSVPQIFKNGKLAVHGGFTGLSKLSDTELNDTLGDIDVTNWSI